MVKYPPKWWYQFTLPPQHMRVLVPARLHSQACLMMHAMAVSSILADRRRADNCENIFSKCLVDSAFVMVFCWTHKSRGCDLRSEGWEMGPRGWLVALADVHCGHILGNANWRQCQEQGFESPGSGGWVHLTTRIWMLPRIEVGGGGGGRQLRSAWG